MQAVLANICLIFRVNCGTLNSTLTGCHGIYAAGAHIQLYNYSISPSSDDIFPCRLQAVLIYSRVYAAYIIRDDKSAFVTVLFFTFLALP